MSNKTKKILLRLLLCTAGAAALYFGLCRHHDIGYAYTDIIMNIYILEEEEERSALLAVQSKWEETFTIYWNGIALPYDKRTNTCYLPLNVADTDWTGKLKINTSLAAENYVICGLEDAYWYEKEKAVRENHVFDLWLTNTQTSIPLHLIFTGMPMANIVTTEEVQIENKRIAPVDFVPGTTDIDPESLSTMDDILYGEDTQYFGTITVFDPDLSGENYTVTQSRLEYHQKGGSSSYFEKKSYSLTLLDKDGGNNKQSLLGMRRDDDWKLNSLYTDEYRIREKTASQIWEKIDIFNAEVSEAGPHMEYIEVVLDNEYLGLYALTEPVDAKKCNLEEEDILYKVADLYLPEEEEIRLAAGAGWNAYQSVRIRFPKAITDYQKTWQPIKDYLILLDNASSEETPDPDSLLSCLDLENVLDYLIFIQTVSASDNSWKNIYYAAHKQEDNRYRMIQHPWDLDYTFGNNFVIDDEGRPVDRLEEDHTNVYMEMTAALLFDDLWEAPETSHTAESSSNEASSAETLSAEHSSDESLSAKYSFAGPFAESPVGNDLPMQELSQPLSVDDMVSMQKTSEYKRLLKERYQEYRSSILSTDSIFQLMDENAAYLKQTGAAARETLRWTDRKVNTNLSQLKAFQSKRMKWLDQCLTDPE